MPNSSVSAARETQLNPLAGSYQEDVWESAWKGRARGLWSGVAMGICIGGLIGVLAALSAAFVVPLAVAVSLIAPVAGVFAVTGMAMAMLTCTESGAVSGAVAGGLKEQDQRALGEGKAIAFVQQKNMSLMDRLDLTRGSKKLFDGNVAIVGALAGLAVGALLVAAGGVPAIAGMAAIAALHASAHAVAAYVTMTGCALFGTVFALDMPTISKHVSSLMGSILSGEIFEPRMQTVNEPVMNISPAAPEGIFTHNLELPAKIKAIVNNPPRGDYRQRISDSINRMAPALGV